MENCRCKVVLAVPKNWGTAILESIRSMIGMNGSVYLLCTDGIKEQINQEIRVQFLDESEVPIVVFAGENDGYLETAYQREAKFSGRMVYIVHEVTVPMLLSFLTDDSDDPVEYRLCRAVETAQDQCINVGEKLKAL